MRVSGYILISSVVLFAGSLGAFAATWTGGGGDDQMTTQGNWGTTFDNTGTGYVGFNATSTLSNDTVNASSGEFRIGGTSQALNLSENVTLNVANSGFRIRTTGNLNIGTTAAGNNVVNFNGGTVLVNGAINTTAATVNKNKVNLNGGVVAWNGTANVGWGNSNQEWASNGGSTLWLASGSGGNFQLNNSIALNAGNLLLRNDTANRILIVQGGLAGTGSISTYSGANPGGVIQFSGNYASSGSVTVGADTELRLAAVDRFTGAGQSAAVAVTGLMNLNAAGRSQTIGALSGSGEVRIAAGAGTTYLSANSDGSTSTFAGNFSSNGTLRLNNAASKLTLTGNSSAFTGNAAVDAGTLLVKNTFGATNVSVGASGLIGGNSTISGDLDFAAGGKIVFSATDTLTVGGTVTFDGFSVADVYGLDGTVADGIYTLIDGTVDFANVSNVGIGNAYSIGGGKSAYFQSGSLDLVVISEPATIVLTNGDFEAGTLNGWAVSDWDGDSKTEISGSVESTNPLNGSFSAKINIAANSDGAAHEAYVLNFYQDIPVVSGRYYQGRFTVRSSQNCEFYIQLYKPTANYDTFAYQLVSVGTAPQTVNFGGTANFTATGRVMFNLGKVTPGTTIWIDDISLTELTPAATTAAVAVNFAQSESAPSLSGFLLGVDINNVVSGHPDGQYVTPLSPAYWRVNWNTNYTARVASYGATPIVLVSEGKYPGWNTNSIASPTPWSDGYVSWSNHCVSVAQNHGTNVVYDIWNEPDISGFFLNWPDATFERFLETFKVAHNAIRSIKPNARISGPSLSASYSPLRLTQFMNYCKTNSLTVQVLSLHMLDHDDPAFGQMEQDLLAARSNYIDNATYAAVGLQDLHVNEFLGDSAQWLRPGSILSFMRFMENAGVDAACRSAWTNPDNSSNSAFDGSLDGVLTGTTHLPRAAWWAHKWYADGAGSRVSATSNNGEIIPLASRNSSTNRQAQLLIASRGYTGSARDMSNVTVSVTNLASTGFIPANATNMLVSVYRVAFSGNGSSAVSTPAQLITNQNIAVSGGTAQFVLTDVNAYDAQLITLAKANRAPVIQQSAPTVNIDEDGTPTAWSAPVLSAIDADGDPLVWSLLSSPTGGIAQISGTGASPALFNYTPSNNWNGTDGIGVRVTDSGSLSDSITVTVNVAADSLPTAWETTYGVILPAADADDDGDSNLAEYLLGTVPNSAASRFVMQTSATNLPGGTQGFLIAFETVSGRHYFLRRTLQLPVPEWSDVTNFPGSGATAVVIDTNLTDRAFYRVRVEMP